MHQYELMVILDPQLDERAVAPNLDKFLAVITGDGGTVDKVDIWGRRKLAFEINKKSEGIYAVVDFTAKPATTQELDRQLNLSEAVMRTKVLRAEESIAQVATVTKQRAERAARKAVFTSKNQGAVTGVATTAAVAGTSATTATTTKAPAKPTTGAQTPAAVAAATQVATTVTE